jgi:ABC-2 type transport system ATP-binding protein
MYISEYLYFIASLYKIKNKKSRVEEMIECTGLSTERHKKIDSLSKGYRQRVGLAQALLPDPEALILDEPTTGLDPNQIGEIRNLIKKLGQSKTILLSTHIMQEVKAICERVIIIHAGSIVADEHTDKLESLNLSGETVIEMEFDKNINHEKLLNIQGITKIDNFEGNFYTIYAVTEQDIRYSIFRFAVENNLVILSMLKKNQSLEDVFKALTA